MMEGFDFLMAASSGYFRNRGAESSGPADGVVPAGGSGFHQAFSPNPGKYSTEMDRFCKTIQADALRGAASGAPIELVIEDYSLQGLARYGFRTGVM